MKVDKKRKPGFYWVRFEGSIIVAEWSDGKRNPKGWNIPGCATAFSDKEVCELLSNRMVFLGA